MSNTALFVVDMQPAFTSYKYCMKEVFREIKLARRRKDPIVFVELNTDMCGLTIPELLAAARSRNYDKVAITSKIDCDGSSELVKAAREIGFKSGRVRVCGVSRYACVVHTIEGLMLMNDVEAVEVSWSATAPGGKLVETGKREFAKYVERGLVIRK